MKFRPQQLSEEIIRIANEVLLSRVEIPRDMLITVTGVELSNDLREATLFVSILPTTKRGSGLDMVRTCAPLIRSSVASSTRMKRVPQLVVNYAATDLTDHAESNSSLTTE